MFYTLLLVLVTCPLLFGSMSHYYYIAVTPTVSDLTLTNDNAMDDPVEGTVILRAPGSAIVTAVVTSDPCPYVVWRFDGREVAEPDYCVNDPCNGNLPSPFTFTLNIVNLTQGTSGRYSAAFSNLGGSTPLPGLLVTVTEQSLLEGNN